MTGIIIPTPMLFDGDINEFVAVRGANRLYM